MNKVVTASGRDNCENLLDQRFEGPYKLFFLNGEDVMARPRANDRISHVPDSEKLLAPETKGPQITLLCHLCLQIQLTTPSPSIVDPVRRGQFSERKQKNSFGALSRRANSPNLNS